MCHPEWTNRPKALFCGENALLLVQRLKLVSRKTENLSREALFELVWARPSTKLVREFGGVDDKSADREGQLGGRRFRIEEQLVSGY